MMLRPMCQRCKQTTGGFQQHVCHRPELGPRLAGPGFNMRWRRRAFWIGSTRTWQECDKPYLEAIRRYRSVAEIALECIQHDRYATLIAVELDVHDKRRRRLAGKPLVYRAWLTNLAHRNYRIEQAALASVKSGQAWLDFALSYLKGGRLA